MTDLEIVEASTPADWLRAGSATTVRVKVHNPGERSEGTLVVTHAGERVSTHDVTLAAGETVTHELEVTFEEPRDGAVEVNGVAAGELTVGGEDGGPSTPRETDDQGGFGAPVALVVVLAATLWARSRFRGGAE